MLFSIVGICCWVGSERRFWWVRQITRAFFAYVGIYTFLDKAKIFDDYLAQFFPKEQFQALKIGWNSRVVSCINASLITFCGLYSLLTEPENVIGNPVTGHPVFAPIFGAYLYAYCLFDLVLVMWYIDELGDLLIIIHHIMIAAWIANSGFVHANLGAGLFFMTNEISTVFLNLRWFFHKIVTSPYAKEDTISPVLVTTNLLLFALTFFLTRVLGNMWMTYNALYQAFFELSSNTLFVKPYGTPSFTFQAVETNVKVVIGILVPLLCILNLWWFLTIIEKAQEVLSGKKKT